MGDRYERLGFADRWMRDGLRVCTHPGGFGVIDVDMTQALTLLEEFRRSGIRVNTNHVLFRAVALTLSRHPELHKLGAGAKILHPSSVDLGISVAGESFVAPVMVLRNADKK